MKMKALLISATLSLLMATNVLGQDSTRLKRIEYVLGASLTFSLIDYIGYNLVRRQEGSPFWYRCIEATEQTAISYFLYKECGLSSVISFNLIWWTWGDDLGYYGWTNLFNPASPNALNSFVWENRTNSGLLLSDINWAGWTPIGLVRPQGSWIARNALVAQAIIGLSISMAILW
jgi:hypothetical protein